MPRSHRTRQRGTKHFVVLDPDLARRAADDVDAAVARGEDPGPFAGVPFGVKDLEDCAGMPTSHGSLLYKDRPPVAEDSIHVARLRAAGAVPVGKTAAPEFGTVAFTHTKAWGTTRNPWDTERTPGGSSGGTAAAVAAGLVPFGTASDGGGSTRIPAAFSGLVGMKPSHGRIPHPPASTSQTSVYGALTTTVADAARHLDVVPGRTTATGFPCRPAGPLRGCHRVARRRAGCAPRGRSISASPQSIRRSPTSPGARPANWPTPRGSS